MQTLELKRKGKERERYTALTQISKKKEKKTLDR